MTPSHDALAAHLNGRTRVAFMASARTEEELIQQVAQHAAQSHGVKEVTPELAEKVKAAIETR